MRKDNRKFYIQLGGLIFITIALFVLIMNFGDNFNGIASFINGLIYNDSEVIEGEYKEVSIDPCDNKTVAKPNAKANISIDGKYDYYGYTDEKSRVVKVYADKLYRKDNRPGRFCSYTFPHNSSQNAKESIGYVQNSKDDRGHLIADKFDGVSNAYNITAQYGDLNKGEYANIEDAIENALRSNKEVTDFTVTVNYKLITDRRPASYTITFKINNKPYSYTLENK